MTNDPKQNPSQPESPASEAGPLDKLQNPKTLGLSVVLVAVILAGAVFGYRALNSASQEATSELFAALRDAAQAESPGGRMKALELERGTFEGSDLELPYLLTLTRATRRAADESFDSEERMALYQKVLGLCDEIESKHAGNILVRLPWQAATDSLQEAQGVVDRFRGYAKKQLEFTKANPVSISLDPDAELKGKLLLGMGEKEVELRLEFFSSVAPHAVDRFLRNVREGYYEGTSFVGAELPRIQRNPNAPSGPVALIFGSALQKQQPTTGQADWLSAKDNVGFTLPRERHPVALERGTLAFDWLPNAHACSPVRVALYLSVPSVEAQEFCFARVVEEDLPLLESLDALETEADALEGDPTSSVRGLKGDARSWVIRKITVEGEPTRAAESPLPDALRLPKLEDQPQPEENTPEAPKPGEEGGESTPAPAEEQPAPAGGGGR